MVGKSKMRHHLHVREYCTTAAAKDSNCLLLILTDMVAFMEYSRPNQVLNRVTQSPQRPTLVQRFGLSDCAAARIFPRRANRIETLLIYVKFRPETIDQPSSCCTRPLSAMASAGMKT